MHDVIRVARIKGPNDLIQAVPYLVGFTPVESIVVLALNDDAKVVFTARLDLGDNLSEALWPLVPRTEATKAVLVAFGTSRGEVKRALTAAKHRATVPIVDLLWVHDQRWGSLDCDKYGCCPREGTALTDTVSAAVTELIAAGSAPLSSREELAAEIAPKACDESLAAMSARANSLPAMTEPDELLAVDMVTFSVARRFSDMVSVPAGRDKAWLRLESADFDTRQAFAGRLREVARRCPAAARVPSLFLAAWVAWRLGEGARANLAVDAALAIDPDYSPARLLRHAIISGVDPHKLPSLDPTVVSRVSSLDD